MNNFIIVQVDYKYCDYLRKFDSKVPYNSGVKRNRPFVGILFKVGNIEYFTPLSSPKEKHKRMKNSLDFLKIDKGELGAINFNNMIPVNKECYKMVNFSKYNKEEYKYYHMLYLQLLWLNRNSKKVRNNAEQIYRKYISQNLSTKVYNRCCNFPLLEEKCLEYKKSNLETMK